VQHRANYAIVPVEAQLGPESEPDTLDLDWATSAGDETETFEFEVPTADPTDGYLGIQAFEVGDFGHEILINDEPLSGFDIPPNPGWQYWVDTITGSSLVEGTNTLRIVRADDGVDAFAVGTVTVHWKEPAPAADG